MNRLIIFFIIFLFGVMAGYGWQNYHHGLQIAKIKTQIEQNHEFIKFLLETGDILTRELDEFKEDLQAKQSYEMEVKITGYCNSPICINDVRWQDGMTATGTIARVGVCAADWSVIPIGTIIYVEGYGFCRVEDRGGKVKGNHIDLFFNTYKEAKGWGLQNKKVKIFL